MRAAASPRERIRGHLRDAAVRALSTTRSVPRSSWIRFPYYHHVFDDERTGFEAQLGWMKRVAEPVSLDNAVTLLEDRGPLDGRYFCITFDDGYRNCVTNAMPILAEHEVPGAFFIATAYVGSSVEERDPSLLGRIGAYDRYLMEVLTWDDCRQLVHAGMTVGSHAVSHPRLIDLDASEVERELRLSKATIEREVGMECRHFACPKGRPAVDFLPDRDPAIAARVGYRSFSTTKRGTVHIRPTPMLIPRDHIMAGWTVHQLRYFFSR